MGEGICVWHNVSTTPFSSGGGLLTVFFYSKVSFLPLERAFHELLHGKSFTQAVVLHELLQRGLLQWGAVLQEWISLSWVPTGVTSPASKSVTARGPPSKELQAVPGALCSTGFPWGTITLCARSCSTSNCHGGQGHSCLSMVCKTDCIGISSLMPLVFFSIFSIFLHWPWCLQTFLLLSFSSCCTTVFSSFKICYHREKMKMLFLSSYSCIKPKVPFGHQLYLKPIYIVAEHFKFTRK